MMNPMDQLRPPTRLMLTPGPSCITRASTARWPRRWWGMWIPWFTEFMGGVQELLRRVFQTRTT